jgi:hypothetical protein
MALAVIMVLPVWYVGSYLGWRLAVGNTGKRGCGHVAAVGYRISPVWNPIRRYKVSDLPLSTEFVTIDLWCQTSGGFYSYSSWSEARSSAEYWKKYWRSKRSSVADTAELTW